VVVALATGFDGAFAAEDPLQVRVDLPRKRVYVGQALEIRVGVAAEGMRPAVSFVRSDAFDPVRVREEFVPLGESKIGNDLNQKNLFITRYRLIPRSAGRLVVPSFSARLGGRAGASAEQVVTVSPVPPGRPIGFLGGVGRITIETEVEPAVVRVGTPFEVRLRLSGPGARASVEPIDISSLESLECRPTIRQLPPVATDDPPARIVRYRLTPARAALERIPPFLAAWFDPDSSRYFTARSESVPIRVEEVPRFDDSQLGAVEAVPDSAPEAPVVDRSLVAIILAPGAVLACIVLIRMRARERPEKGDHDVEAFRTSVAASGDRVAWVVSRAMAELVEAEGEPETSEIVESGRRAGWSDETIALGRSLYERCLEARFSGRSAEPASLTARAFEFADALQEDPASVGAARRGISANRARHRS
jgi:hypothetical protein